MNRLVVPLIAISLCLGSAARAQADSNENQWQQQPLGQSDWQVPQQSQNQWQQPTQQPAAQSQQLGQSDWQVPQQSQNQWQQPQQLGQSQWQTPPQNQNQNQWQQPSNQQTSSTFYGQARTDQVAPQDQTSQNQEPGAYLNQQYNGNLQSGNFANQPGSQTKTKKAHIHKEKDKDRVAGTGGSDGLKSAAGAIGRAVAVGAGIAAPLAGAYLIGKSISRSSYGGYGYPYGGGSYYRPPIYPPMNPGYGYPGGSYPPYGYGYGNGLSSFMHF